MPKRLCGFSLLELSIVLVILALLLAGGAAMFGASVQKSELDETNTKIAAIKKALFQFRVAYNRLPCPADNTQAYGVANYGIEAANPGKCAGGTPVANKSLTGTFNIGTATATMGSPLVSYTNTSSLLTVGQSVNVLGFPATVAKVDTVNHIYTLSQSAQSSFSSGSSFATWNYATGMVPTKTLQLPDDYAIDGWGRRISYGVMTGFTGTDVFSSLLISYPITGFYVRNSATLFGTDALYVLISWGPEGNCAYPRNGGTLLADNTVNTEEIGNCTFFTNTSSSVSTFYQDIVHQDYTNPLNTFDHVVAYGTRRDLRSAAE